MTWLGSGSNAGSHWKEEKKKTFPVTIEYSSFRYIAYLIFKMLYTSSIAGIAVFMI